MSLKYKVAQVCGETRTEADAVRLSFTALPVNLGLSLLSEPGLPTSGPVELQPSEGGPQVFSHQLPLQTFIQLVCSTGVLHLALLKHDADAFKMSYTEGTSSNKN